MIACGSLSQKDSRKAKTELKPTLPLPNKEKEQNHSLLGTKRGEKKGFTTVTTNVCACSI